MKRFYFTLLLFLFFGCNRTNNQDTRRADSLQAKLDSITRSQQTQNGNASSSNPHVANDAMVKEEISQWKSFRNNEEKYRGELL